MRIADLFEEKWVEETDDDDQIVLLRLIDPFVGNILYLFILILTVCELHILLKQRLRGLMLSLLSLYLIPFQLILVEIFLRVAFIFQLIFLFYNFDHFFVKSNFIELYKMKDMEAMLTWMIFVWILRERKLDTFKHWSMILTGFFLETCIYTLNSLTKLIWHGSSEEDNELIIIGYCLG